jgi:ribonuclease-3
MEDFTGNKALEDEIGYSFTNKQILVEARTHSSFSHENGGRDNSNLAHLGDAVLTLVILDRFYDIEDLRPGLCDRIKQTLVSNQALGNFALEKRLGEKYLIMGVGGKEQKHYESIDALAAFVEAIIGAVFRDAGYEGYAEAKKVVESWILKSQYEKFPMIKEMIVPDKKANGQSQP